MTDSPKTCVKSDAGWSGAASLATVSAHHGVPLSPAEVAALSHIGGASSHEEGNALVMGRALGYEPVAMEGEYENLPEVSLPMLVALREESEARYAVLFAVGDAEVTVGDPKTGDVSVWPRPRFAAVWTGSVVQLTPVDEERRALGARLAEHRDLVRRSLRAMGWAPPYGRRVAMLAAWVAVFGVARLAPHGSPLALAWTWLVAMACAGSLWSWLASDACGSCSYAARLGGGLPLAQAGAGLYGVLLASAFAPVPPVATTVAVGLAAGAHGALVLELASAKVACWACVFVAACATGAAGVAIAGGAPSVPLLAAAVLAGGATHVVLPRARARQERAWRVAAEALARATMAEPASGAGVRLVAFTRKGCSMCAFFHAAVKPALGATFGDALTIDERDLGRTITVAPVLLVLGPRPTLFVGLPADDACGRVLEAVRNSVEASPESIGELVVVHSI